MNKRKDPIIRPKSVNTSPLDKRVEKAMELIAYGDEKTVFYLSFSANPEKLFMRNSGSSKALATAFLNLGLKMENFANIIHTVHRELEVHKAGDGLEDENEETNKG